MATQSMQDAHGKLIVSLRYWLQGKQYYNALKALRFAADYHIGIRKDGITPEFQHQLRIAHHVRTLTPCLLHPEETIAVALTHDTSEDYNVEPHIITSEFGPMVGNSTWIMTKKFRGVKQSDEAYYANLTEDPIGSIVKGCDRVHNVQSMPGVFNDDKQAAYVDEAERFVLPMLKMARRNFPEQELAYENIKHVLVNQIELIRYALTRAKGSAA